MKTGANLVFIYNKAIKNCLNYTLLKHCLSDLHESGDICTLNIIDVAVWLSTVLDACLVDVRHDAVKFLVNLSRAPADVHCVLSHFKT